MGFGFNLFFIIVLLPLSIILILLWIFTRKKIFGRTLAAIWIGIYGLFFLIGFISFCKSKKVLDKDDYYGHYIFNRDLFSGDQADWQYNHYRFEIKKNDSIYFYVTAGDKIIETYHGSVKTTNPQKYNSQRLIIKMDEPTHHIMCSNPTIYRSSWSFYLAFYSSIYNNVFFKKGKWKPIN